MKLPSRPSRPRAGALWLAALALAACSPSGRDAAPPPIVLVSIDTLRADRLPAYGFSGVETPAIDALARDAILFADARAPYPLTLPSHATLFTGRLTPVHGIRDNIGYTLDSERHATLAARLARRGYATAGFASSFVLRRATGVAAGFDTWDAPDELPPGAPLDAAQRPAEETVSAALRWLERLEGRTPFLFVHLYEPHAPYQPPEPFRSRYADPYLGEIATADAAVGRLLDGLRAAGLYPRAVVALVSDHGEGLGDHGEIQHGVFLYRSTLHVPLILKLPSAAGAGDRRPEPVGLVDLAPTLLALAGVEPGGDGDGVDLLAGAGSPDRMLFAETFYPRLHFGWSELESAADGRWSLIEGPRPELFDLEADPGETRDVLAANRRERARLAREIENRRRPLAAPAAADAEVAARLASLGYLAAAAGPASGPLPDPRTQRPLLAALESGLDAFWNGRDAEAVERLRAVLAANDRMRDVWSYLARALDRLGRSAEALTAWDRVLELSSGEAQTLLFVGEKHLAAGDAARARGLAQLAAKSEPTKAEELLAQIDVAEGQPAAAAARLGRAAASGEATETSLQRVALDALAGGDPRRAEELLAPREAAGTPETLILLALARSELGRETEGVALLERARRGSARQSGFYESLGIALLRLERFERAGTAFEEAVRREPGLATAWNALGIARARSDQPPARALEAWQRAVALDARLADAWFNLGLGALATGDRVAARAALERYLALVPASGPAAADRARAEAALASLGAAR